MLIEVFKGTWLPADSVSFIYISHEPKIKGDIRAPKYFVMVKAADETFYSEKIETEAEAHDLAKEIVQRLNAYRS